MSCLIIEQQVKRNLPFNSPPFGAEAPTFRSEEEAPPSLLSMECIVVAVKALHHSTIPGVDPIDLAYSKRAGGAYGNPTQVNPSCFQVPWDLCSYQIARRVAAYPLLLREVAADTRLLDGRSGTSKGPRALENRRGSPGSGCRTRLRLVSSRQDRWDQRQVLSSGATP